MTADQPTSSAASTPAGIDLRDSPGLVPPRGHYSHDAVHAGVAYISGQLPLDPTGTPLADQPFDAQVQQVLSNLHDCLITAGSSREQLLSVTVYATDIDQWPARSTSRSPDQADTTALRGMTRWRNPASHDLALDQGPVNHAHSGPRPGLDQVQPEKGSGEGHMATCPFEETMAVHRGTQHRGRVARRKLSALYASLVILGAGCGTSSTSPVARPTPVAPRVEVTPQGPAAALIGDDLRVEITECRTVVSDPPQMTIKVTELGDERRVIYMYPEFRVTVGGKARWEGTWPNVVVDTRPGESKEVGSRATHHANTRDFRSMTVCRIPMLSLGGGYDSPQVRLNLRRDADA
jgi:enamine deaminase RidA (YjgF/YER057c/UK114 family)